MAWNPTDREVESLIGSDASTRYRYFVHRVADEQRLWGLSDGNDGFVGGRDDESGAPTFAVWPHRCYAEAMQDTWPDREPEAISIDEWLDDWSEQLSEDGILTAVFPTPDGSAVPVEPERLAADLREELKNY